VCVKEKDRRKTLGIDGSGALHARLGVMIWPGRRMESSEVIEYQRNEYGHEIVGCPPRTHRVKA